MSRRKSSRRRSEAGFTMIEAVIALALLSIVLAAVGSLVARNVRGAQQLEQHTALMQTARLIASRLPQEGQPLPTELSGREAGYRWQMRISPFVDADTAVPDSPFVPQRVELRVQSPTGAIVSFETVRLQYRDGRQ
ncbi:prepilin-type N-terminal cleavage/methylation domain-containing protein [Bradyrhizobium commune]|uniref:Prepilin-type N-terminal cleavage/methylation domain-containing protein n=2 Tax=Bradyrhizobium commune TaxID=83627 RepID=A0A7S9DB63_9BRAD|nr:prepilin-type N-terminal cleavage/methylation domain-containing protein [Bradyrhizobium commune]